MGITILVQAIAAKDALIGLAGLLFAAMAVFNAGCCGSSGSASAPKKSSEIKKNITYEEVV